MSIAIIGCGYLGTGVAFHWRKKGIHVTATTRNPEQLDSLSLAAQKSLILKGNDEEELVPLISNNEVIIVTAAADSPELYESGYQNTAQILKHLALEMDEPRQLIYVSTTSLYGNHHGQWVDEKSELLSQTQQAKILIESEKHYQSLSELGWNVAILRLSEIYGPGKELSKRVKQLEGHILPGTGEHYTNMIHQTDAIHAIDFALKHRLEGIFNVSDTEQPTRRELYDRIAHQFQLPRVKWDPSHTPLDTANKRVSTHKIKAEGFALRHAQRILD